MEEELGAPMFCAVVVEKQVTDNAVELQVRYHRKSIFDGKRKAFKVIVNRGPTDSEYRLQRYLSAKQLKPGDELYVDPYGEDWTDPMYYGKIRRKWNLKFA
ncbi:MAG: hypothetical protein IKN71_06460 [Alphaproteobacteria bacterium]|nr:hypothetical protein [Alphaproteobacteria bacterium]